MSQDTTRGAITCRPLLAPSLLIAVALTLLLSGCGPSKEQVRLQRAMTVRAFPQPDFADSIQILDFYRGKDLPEGKKNKYRNEFVQYGMCETSVAMLGGNTFKAEEVARETWKPVQQFQDENREFLAAMGNEAIKYFKGEPHERALLAFYAGLTCYMRQEYNDARIYFTQSLNATATRDEDMKEFREDFQLGNFWLGRAFLKLGNEDNARVAFTKARVVMPRKEAPKEWKDLKAARERAYKEELQGESLCYKQGTDPKKPVERIEDLSKGVARSEFPSQLAGASQATPFVTEAASPDAFLSVDFQKNVNLLLLVEMGIGPYKKPSRISSSFDDVARIPSKEWSVDVYIDGHHGNSGLDVLDTYDQAATRGVQTRRGRQLAKAIAKEILKNAPLVGGLASYWDVNADFRYWPGLPGRYSVYAAQLVPGAHTVHLKFSDINGRYLPRFDVTRHFIVVPEKGETVILLYSVENQDNAYVLTQPTGK